MSNVSTGEAASRTVVVEGDSPAEVHRTRDVARAFAGNLDPVVEDDAVEALTLVVTELASNALRHGGGRYTLQLDATAHTLSVAVSDLNSVSPHERTPDMTGATGGFGWRMIRRLTNYVAITPGPHPGKTIHACLTRCPTGGAVPAMA
ncbi:ATP-binding protein [Streptomyces sp. SYP-A7185]|uniref:ATP-binding protein n=1 Tax=Streptomyces sp. SYP-A7185 TaxID=3040076 RepID=UPI0038F81D10